MKIGFDAKRAMRNFTGLGNYSRYVIGLLADNAPDNNYIAYSPKHPAERAIGFFNDRSSVDRRYPRGIVGKLFPSLWRSLLIVSDIRRDKVDVYHGLSGELPSFIGRITGTKTVVTVHDLIFRHYPKLYKPFDRLVYDIKSRRACKMADVVIAISEFTKRDIICHYHIDPEKIQVIYQGCDSSFMQPQSPERLMEVKKKYSLPDRYILNVGTVEERKNVLLAVKALENTEENVSLVIVGKATPYTESVLQYARDKGLSDRLLHISGVDFRDLPCIYRMAQIFVYPSRIEGFGIPILEALWSGVPVIAATGSCLEEAGGPDSIYIDPDDHSELAACFNRLLADDSIRKRMVEKGLEYAKTFSDTSFCVKTMALYRKLLASGC